MLIVIEDTYRGYVYGRTLEAGEHEVPDSVGEYLIDNFSGPPFFARRVEKAVPLETKPVYPLETKPSMPAEPKPKPKPVRRRTVKAKVKP